MSKYKNHQPPVSSKTIHDANIIARVIQKPNQTKEQTIFEKTEEHLLFRNRIDEV